MVDRLTEHERAALHKMLRLWPWFVRIFAVLALVFAIVVASVLSSQRGYAQDNRRAVRVSCLLLSDQVLQSGASTLPRGYKLSDAALASRRRSERFIRILVRSATPADLQYIARQTQIIEEAGGVLTPPDCDRAANDAEAVERELDGAQRRLAASQRKR